MNVTVRNQQIQWNAENLNQELTVDGVFGKETAKKPLEWPYKPKALKRIFSFYAPEKPVRCSSFGGRDDNGDNLNGLANIPTWNDALEYPDLFDAREIREFYKGNGLVRSKDGQSCGLSGYLKNNSGMYAALFFKLPSIMKGRAVPKIRVWNPESPSKCVTCHVVDHGPDPLTGRGIDLSDAAMLVLNLKTDDLCMWEWWI